MIEEKIEARVISKLENALSGIADTRFLGQLSCADGIKALEDADDHVIVVVKAAPRSYSTPTIPTCQIDVQVNALIRADVDYNGESYLDVSDKLMQVFQQWQRCYEDTHEDFNLSGEFECSGFQLGSGDFSLDSTGKVWSYQHTLTIYGVVQF